MRFEDEIYVRVYTRDTIAWMAMRWESRCVLLELFRKVDRAGLIDLGEDGLDGLAVALRMPLEVVEPGLSGLLRRGSVRQVGTTLVIPNFVAAQEARQSDRVRQQASRERARDLAAASLRNVTPRDEPSQYVTPIADSVTRGHTESQPVTLSLAELSLAELSLAGGEARAARSGPRGTRIPDGWQPKPETIRRFAEREGVDCRPCIEPFALFWASKASNATKLDWEKTFMSWVLRDIDRLPPAAKSQLAAPSEPQPEPEYGPPDPVELARFQDAMARLAKAKTPELLRIAGERDAAMGLQGPLNGVPR